ncbi:MAG: VCBS repeat-containing protein, partial [Planctomycetaceae bacterium]|nr:VCBS repeat-containing protein [Planctomycetaceae bacterium]
MPFDWLKTLRSSLSQRRFRSTLGAVVQLEARTLLSAKGIGPETQVNTFTTNDQIFSAIAVDADGDYVVTWSSDGQDGDGFGIFAQRYSPSGTPQGSEFQVNTYTTSFQGEPTIGMDADGDFVIAWQSYGQDGSTDGIYAKRYNSSGSPQGSEFLVNSRTTGQQTSPSIGVDASGNFVISWTSFGQDGSNRGVYAQRYDSTGAPQGSEFLVNTFTSGNQDYSEVAVDADGDFVITWHSYAQDGNVYGIYAQRYNAMGTAQGTEFKVNSFTTSDQRFPSVGMDADGDFVITWQSYFQDGSDEGIYAQRFDASGVPQGGEFRVNSFTSGKQANSRIGMGANGEFVIAWNSENQDGSGNGVYAKRYNSAGVAQGGEFRVNSTTTSVQAFSGVGMDSDGDFVITWSSYFQDGAGSGIYSQRYRVTQADALGIWRAGDFYLDSNHSNDWNGGVTDTFQSFGATTDTILAGDWNGDGYTDIGVWREGTFYLDSNGNGVWEGAATDRQFVFGNPTDTPIVGDWNQDGRDEIGVWRAGRFYLDLNGNRVWDLGVDTSFPFGNPSDIPITGDWDGDGTDDVGIRRNAEFYLDSDGDRVWNVASDDSFPFGNSGDTPIVGDWDGDGTDNIGVWRAGEFYQDSNSNYAWNLGVDQVFTFGLNTDTPLIGYWRPKTIPAPASLPGALPPTNSSISNSTPTTQPDE